MRATQSEIHALPFSVRAELPNTPPLARYLLLLISIKRSTLCVSADVHTTSALLRLAEEVGDSICVLKTHADIIDDFSAKTIRALDDISRRKHFLIFEDRKLGDIGNTVQSQYTRGPLKIATWAHITNAHLLPGPAIVPALRSAATATLTALNQSVSTEITTGSPCLSVDESASDDDADADDPDGPPSPVDRKSSVVKAITTISQTYEPSPPDDITLTRSLSSAETTSPHDREEALQNLGPPPHARALLLLAQMSSEGNLMTPAYTDTAVAVARDYPDFVVGFVAQHSLNAAPGDAFLHFTPGVSFPPDCARCSDADAAADAEPGAAVRRGDGLGQRWRSPRQVVRDDGADVIIVGRGVLNARNRAKEAERYRRAAWEAYEERIGRQHDHERGKS